ncbi:MAG: IS66 family insertion sequence element accessory protein TnpA, partial [Sphingobacterium sp.]
DKSSLSQYMHAEVIAYHASNLPVHKFCEGKPYTFHKLNYWILKIRKEQKGGQYAQRSGFSSIKVSSPRGVTSTANADIIYPNGIRIAIYEPLTASLLKSLL